MLGGFSSGLYHGLIFEVVNLNHRNSEVLFVSAGLLASVYLFLLLLSLSLKYHYNNVDCLVSLFYCPWRINLKYDQQHLEECPFY